jgi:hypothetical protein
LKKILLPLLILVIIIQLGVPAYFVYEKYDTLKTGKEYKFEIELYDPYDAFRGRYVALTAVEQNKIYNYTSDTFSGSRFTGGRYGIIVTGKDGFAVIDSTVDLKPASGDYVKSVSSRYFALPIERYYLDEELAPGVQSLLLSGSRKLKPYVILRVKNGNAVIQGLYINGIRIEDYASKQ